MQSYSKSTSALPYSGNPYQSLSSSQQSKIFLENEPSTLSTFTHPKKEASAPKGLLRANTDSLINSHPNASRAPSKDSQIESRILGESVSSTSTFGSHYSSTSNQNEACIQQTKKIADQIKLVGSSVSFDKPQNISGRGRNRPPKKTIASETTSKTVKQKATVTETQKNQPNHKEVKKQSLETSKEFPTYVSGKVPVLKPNSKQIGLPNKLVLPTPVKRNATQPSTHDDGYISSDAASVTSENLAKPIQKSDTQPNPATHSQNQQDAVLLSGPPVITENKMNPIRFCLMYFEALDQWVNDPHEKTPKEIKLRAKSRIIESQNNGSTGLDLNGLGLCSVPPLFGLVGLTGLYLDDNKISSVSKSHFERLPALQEVSLSGNNFSSLDLSCFSKNSQLKRLYINRNQIDTLLIKDSEIPSSLEELNLSDNQIKSIDHLPLQKIVHLKTLDLSYNLIDQLDAYRLPNVKSLNLSNNRIIHATNNAFSGYDKLENLNLEHNQLNLGDGSFKVDLKPCHQLRVLKIGHNPLNNLTKLYLSKKNELTHLDCSHTLLRSLESLTSLPLEHLIGLDCAGNHLSKPTLNLDKYPKLKNISLENCSVSSLKHINLGKTHPLESMNLKGNNLGTCILKKGKAGFSVEIEGYTFPSLKKLRVELTDNNLSDDQIKILKLLKSNKEYGGPRFFNVDAYEHLPQQYHSWKEPKATH